MILAISRVSGRHPWPNPWHGETGVYPTGTREKDDLSGRLTGLQITPIFEIWLPININNDEWILKLVCFLVTQNHIIRFMNNKTANIENFGNRIRKLASIFSLCTYFYVIVEYTYPTRGVTRHPQKLTRVSGIYPQTDPPKQRHGWHPKPNQPRVFFTGAEPCWREVIILLNIWYLPQG